MDDDDLTDTVIRQAQVRPLAGVGRQDVDGDTVVRAVSAGASYRPSTVEEPPPDVPLGGRNRISINGGQPLTLEESLILGRHPRMPRVLSGPTPKLVVLHSPREEVSGTHIELTPVGASIVVTDLRSTNGTVIVMPGAARVMMSSGDSMVAVPGSVIELGDGNRVEVLPPPRLSPAPPAMQFDGYPVDNHKLGEFER